MKNIKVVVDLDNLSKQLDPLSIPTLSDAFFVNHLYGNLVEFDEKQIIRAALAKDFYWVGSNELVFEFDEKSPISAEDAHFNLQRIIFNAKNLHGDLIDLICGLNESVEDCLSRIRNVEGKLRISFANVNAKDFLLGTLASIDYKIVPIVAFDSNDFKVAKITNYTKTSGHYYLSSKYVLNRNSFDYLQFHNDFDKIQIIHSTSQKIVDLLKSENVDVISSTVPLTASAVELLKEKKIKIYETYPLSVFFLAFSQKALTEINVEDRFSAGKLIFSELGTDSLINSKVTDQFIQDFGQGYLTKAQMKEIRSLRKLEKKTSPKLKRKIRLAVRNLERWKPFALKHSEFELVKISGSVLNLPEDERPDIFAITNDVSFETDLALLTFALKNNFLKLNNLSSSEIIKNFISLDSKERILFINKIHYYSMRNCISFPLYASPYTTATFGDIEANQSKLNSRTLLWLLK